MNPIPLKDYTRRLGAPGNWDHGKTICHTLEICDVDGWMISAWVPTEAELKRLVSGRPIYLHVSGTAHPVVALTVGEDE